MYVCEPALLGVFWYTRTCCWIYASKTVLRHLSHLHFCFLSASSAAKQVSSAESQEKGQKRKSLEEEEEEKNGREELVEKKVCKGFQTIWKQMYSICTFGVGLSKSRTKLSFGSSVCLPFQPLVGNKLLQGFVEAPWASWLCLPPSPPYCPCWSSRHLSTGRIRACAAKRGLGFGISVRLDPHHFVLPLPQISAGC